MVTSLDQLLLLVLSLSLSHGFLCHHHFLIPISIIKGRVAPLKSSKLSLVQLVLLAFTAFEFVGQNIQGCGRLERRQFLRRDGKEEKSR